MLSNDCCFLSTKNLAVVGCMHLQLSLVLMRHLYHPQRAESLPTVMRLSEKADGAKENTFQ